MMWKEKYNIGVNIIDKQHKELFNRVSDFIQTVQGAGDWEQKISKVKETLSFMQDYVIFHFKDEEDYQREINYPDLDEHLQIHKNFTDEVGQYAEKFAQEGYDKELVQEFAGKLLSWLINHVAATDQKIGEYVLNKEGN